MNDFHQRYQCIKSNSVARSVIFNNCLHIFQQGCQEKIEEKRFKIEIKLYF